MLRSPIIALGLVLGAAIGNAHAEPPAGADLRYKFNLGDKLNYHVEMSTKYQDLENKTYVRESKQTLNIIWQVTSVDRDGKAYISQRIYKVRLVTITSKGKVTLDSKDMGEPTDPEINSLAKMVRGIADGEVTFILDRQGQVSNVKPSEITTRLIKDLDLSRYPFGDPFCEAGIKKLTEQTFVIFPEKTPSNGDSWFDRRVSKEGSRDRVDSYQYTLDGPARLGDRKVLKIAVKHITSSDEKGKANVSFTISSQKGSGTLIFDPAAGRFVEATMTQVLEWDVNIMGSVGGYRTTDRTSMKLIEPTR